MSPATNPKKMRYTVAAVTAVLLGVLGLTACSGDTRTENPAVVQADDDGFNGTVIDPPLRPANVVLTDTRGAKFDLARPAPDKVTALFFGFTNCADVCPTTMADLAVARQALPPELADKVTVVFVTVGLDDCGGPFGASVVVPAASRETNNADQQGDHCGG